MPFENRCGEINENVSVQGQNSRKQSMTEILARQRFAQDRLHQERRQNALKDAESGLPSSTNNKRLDSAIVAVERGGMTALDAQIQLEAGEASHQKEIRKDVRNKKRAESAQDVGAVTSVELAASGRAQPSGWKNPLRTALVAALVTSGNIQEVYANRTVSVEGISPVVYGVPDPQYQSLNNPANHFSIRDSHNATFNPRSDLGQQRFIELKKAAEHPKSPRAKQGTARRRIKLFKVKASLKIRYTGPRIKYRSPKLSVRWG